MKQVQITSRGIPSKPRSQYRTGGTTTTIMGGGGTDVDLSAYMLLSRWLENFEEKTDASGIPYLYAKKSIVSVGGITMYATEDVVVPSIFDGIPLDNKTIWKNPTTGKIEVIGGTGGSFDESAMWAALVGETSQQINKSHLTDALAGYATTEALNSVSNKLNGFLEGSDTDNIINKWKELEAFLSGMAETDNLAEILETKADKKYVDSTFVTLATKQTITGEKTFSSVLNTAAIKASGAITAPSLAASDYVTIAGIKLRKLDDGALMLEGNLAVTGGITTYAIDPVSASTIMDGVVVDGTTIKKENGKLVAVGGGEAGSVAWGNITGKPSVFATNIANITDLHSSWDGALKAQKPNWLTAVSIATISDLHANWDALLKAAPSSYVTRWPSFAEVTSKPNTLAGYGITDAPTKTGSGASGTWSIGITGNARSASKLQTPCSLWGNDFDGTGPITGEIIASNGIQLPYRGSIVTQMGNLLRTDYSEGDYNDFFELTARGAGSSENKLLGGNSGLLTWSGNRFIFNTYDVGWYAEDGEWMRTYNSLYVPKNVQCKGNIECDNKVICTTLQAKELDIAYGTNYKFVRMGWNGTSGDFASFYVPGSTSQWFKMELRSNGVLYTNGNILAEGGGTYYGSDIRYKSIMQQVKLSLSEIAKAPSFVYHWNKEGMKCDRLNLGGSAQYTQSILPWAVEENDNFLSMDYATVAYTFAVHTARHLLTYETRTDKKIKKLENRVKYLEKQLKKLGYEEASIVDDSSI